MIRDKFRRETSRLLLALLLGAAIVAGMLNTSSAQAKRRFCLAVTVHFQGAGDYTYPVRIIKGVVSCRTARRTLKRFIAEARQAHGWTCFRGHGQDIWSATCVTGSERRPRSEIRAYNPS
jgi:hypothetical protein